MAPTATTLTSIGTPTATPIIATPTNSSGFNGKEFVNNLGSDLAPLLTLFGEQVTKQFLSLSLGWADHILLAVGPLGIITILVSAIRVSNDKVLKAIIGRAREEMATAESELLSSTSFETSELCTPEGIVRQAGRANVLEMVVYERAPTRKALSSDSIELEEVPSGIRSVTLAEAYLMQVVDEESRLSMLRDVFDKFGKFGVVLRRLMENSRIKRRLSVNDLLKLPPNLILNVHNTLPKKGQLWISVVFGICLQVVAVVVPAVTTYHWTKLDGGTESGQNYAYPTYLLGTCLLIAGIILCSYIIDSTSVEHNFITADGYEVKHYFWLQPRQTVLEQSFEAYIILNHHEHKELRTSRRSGSSSDGRRVTIAIIVCLTGFVCQFVGLRALHWSATVTQLGITLLMTCVRAWIRRGISQEPITIRLPDMINPNWTALLVGSACRSSWPLEGEWPSQGPIFHPRYLMSGMINSPVTELITSYDPRITLRRELQSFSSDDSDLISLSDALRNAMGDLYRFFCTGIGGRKVNWVHVIESNGLSNLEPHYAHLELEMSNTGLKAGVLHALLSVWRYSGPQKTMGICIAKVFSKYDRNLKLSFLERHIGALISRGSCLNLMSNGKVILEPDGKTQSYSLADKEYRWTGLSIENMQDQNVYGYLVFDVGEPTAHLAFELLSGFMDALWQIETLKYHEEACTWSLGGSEVVRLLEVDAIVNILVKSGLVSSKEDANILVVSSLARCTIWKDRTVVDLSNTQDKSPQQEEPRRSTSENPQDGAATPSKPEHRPTSASIIPISSASEALRAEDTLTGSVMAGFP